MVCTTGQSLEEESMKLELKSISVWSAVKIGFFLNLVMGFLMGLLAAMFIAPFLALTSSMMPSGGLDGGDMGEMSFGILLVVLPIVYSIGGAIFGTIAFAIGAAVYNFIARLMGGLEYHTTVTEWEEMAGSHPQGGTPAPYPPYTPAPGPQYPYSGSPKPYTPPVVAPQPVEPRPAPSVTPGPPPPPPPPPGDLPQEEPPAAPSLRPDDQSDETDKPLG